MERCSRCGKCLSFCPVYMARLHERFSPRGKYHILSASDAGEGSGRFPEILKACLQCGACEHLCPSGAGVAAMIRHARENQDVHGLWERALKLLLAHPDLGESARRFISGIPFGSGLVSRLLKTSPWGIPRIPQRTFMERTSGNLCHEEPGEGDIILFVGCIQNAVFPEVPEAFKLLSKRDMIIPKGQVCCGLPAWSGGWLKEARGLARRNLEVLSPFSRWTILTLCTSCAYTIKNVWPGLFPKGTKEYRAVNEISRRVEDLTSYLAGRGKDILKRVDIHKVAVSVHLPCHERFLGRRDQDTAMLVKDLKADLRPMKPVCCGHGGTFARSNPETSRIIFQEALKEFERSGGDVLVTTCSGCLLQWRMGLQEIYGRKGRARVLHLAELLLKYSGRTESRSGLSCQNHLSDSARKDCTIKSG